MYKTAVMKLLTVKAAALIIATTAAGGVGLAASTGTLPAALTGNDRASTGLSVAASHRADTPSVAPFAGDRGKDDTGTNGPDGAKGSPSPSLVGLCRAINAGNKDEHGKALENPAFSALVTAAGGKDKVDRFCAAVLASASADPKGQPSRSADTGQGGEHRTGAPTDRPAGKPTTAATTPAHP